MNPWLVKPRRSAYSRLSVTTAAAASSRPVATRRRQLQSVNTAQPMVMRRALVVQDLGRRGRSWMPLDRQPLAANGPAWADPSGAQRHERSGCPCCGTTVRIQSPFHS